MTISRAGWFLIGTTLGSAVGVGVTYICLKDRFDKQLAEEVTALKTHYVERDRELAKKNEEEKKKLEEKVFSKDEVLDWIDYTKMYNAEPVKVEIKNEEVDDISAAAEIISDEDFDNPEFDNYRKISVDYFENGAVFETLSGEEIDGFELIAGDDWKGSFGEYTPNVVYVRNHETMTDYEIIDRECMPPTPEDE